MSAYSRRDILAEITLLSTEAGGRSGPALNGYHPQFHYDEVGYSAAIEFIETDSLQPGQTATVYLTFSSIDEHRGKLFAGQKLAIREGSRDIGRGIVIEVLTPQMKTIGSAMNMNDFLTRLYAAFNAREIETVLSFVTPDVKWANGMEGGFVHGPDGVREYWTRQFEVISAQVTPTKIELATDGRWAVAVHQVVHDMAGALLMDAMLQHRFTIEDGLVKVFEIGE